MVHRRKVFNRGAPKGWKIIKGRFGCSGRNLLGKNNLRVKTKRGSSQQNKRGVKNSVTGNSLMCFDLEEGGQNQEGTGDMGIFLNSLFRKILATGPP